MPSSMSKSQITRFIRICEDQGIGITKTKKGLLVRFPDGTSTTQHFTNSDVRAEKNQIARFRRAGMLHPNDTRQQTQDLPSYITGGTITEKTRRKIVNYVIDQGFPASVLASAVVKDLGVDPAWANRALYHTGFRPGLAKSKKIGRPWYTPEYILDLQDDLGKQEDKDAVPDVPEVPVDPEPEEIPVEVEAKKSDLDPVADLPSQPEDAPEAEVIDFIDDRDSWVVDMEELFGASIYAMMKQKLAVLDVVGMDYELRLWRA